MKNSPLALRPSPFSLHPSPFIPSRATMPPKHRPSDGFSLIELLIVIAVMGILIGLVMPSSEPNLYEQLRAATAILKTDLAYARSLAVTHNSNYQITFDIDNNRYILEHTGSNSALDTLPDSPFREPGESTDQYIVDFDELPHVGPTVRLVVAAKKATEAGNYTAGVDDVEFGTLGETVRSEYTDVWLAVGSDDDPRYVRLMINPITGMIEIGDFTSDGPPDWLLGP